MSGSEIDDGTDKATAWKATKKRLDTIIILRLSEGNSREPSDVLMWLLIL
jgi:hypothetical protein